MKFLSVRDLRGNSADVWRDLPGEKEMVITSNGRPVALLTAVGEDGVEEALSAWRRARAAQALADLQQEAARNGTDRMTMVEIDAEIRKVRRSRRKTPA